LEGLDFVTTSHEDMGGRMLIDHNTGLLTLREPWQDSDVEILGCGSIVIESIIRYQGYEKFYMFREVIHVRLGTERIQAFHVGEILDQEGKILKAIFVLGSNENVEAFQIYNYHEGQPNLYIGNESEITTRLEPVWVEV